MTIAFARKKDGSDVVVAIDTNVVDTAPNGQRKYSDQISTDFLKCANAVGAKQIGGGAMQFAIDFTQLERFGKKHVR